MERYRFLASRRWVAMALVCVALATTCAFLARWQWNRHVSRAATNRTVEQNFSATPVPVDRLLSADVALTPEAEWHPVTVHGRYLSGAQVLLRNRPVDSTPAVHVLTPFEVDTGPDAGRILVVDRGWLELDSGGTVPAAVPAPPEGPMTVTTRLRRSESPVDREATAGQTWSIYPPQVLATAHLDPDLALDGWGWQEEADPLAPLGRLPDPVIDPGPHLSYTFQWCAFGLIALAAFPVLARREARDPAQPGGGRAAPSTHGTPRARTGRESGPARAAPSDAGRTGRLRPRRPTAEEEEDAAVEAMASRTTPTP